MIISYCQNCRREFEDDKKVTLCKCGGVMFMYSKKEIKVDPVQPEEEDETIMDYFWSNGRI